MKGQRSRLGLGLGLTTTRRWFELYEYLLVKPYKSASVHCNKRKLLSEVMKRIDYVRKLTKITKNNRNDNKFEKAATKVRERCPDSTSSSLWGVISRVVLTKS